MKTAERWSQGLVEAPGGARKTYRDGTHRIRRPEETLKSTTPLLPVAGVTRIANVTGLDRIGIPVVMVVRPNARSVSVSQGKGITLAAAKASGVMESIEGHVAETVELETKRAPLNGPPGDMPAVDWRRLPLQG